MRVFITTIIGRGIGRGIDINRDTLDQAIRLHAGEAAAVRDAYLALSESARADLITFLGIL
jgi:CxxC motif-containing protein (DUF1111 family)